MSLTEAAVMACIGPIVGGRVFIPTVIHGETLGLQFSLLRIYRPWNFYAETQIHLHYPPAPTKTARPTNDNIASQILLKIGKSGFKCEAYERAVLRFTLLGQKTSSLHKLNTKQME